MTYKQISYGSEGEDVTKLQQLLNQNGYALDEDGVFGTNTKDALQDYQRKNNLNYAGVADEATWSSLSGEKPSDGSAPIYGSYKPSGAVQQAQALLQQYTQNKPGAYSSQWQSQLDDIIGQLMNRKDFSYDLNSDALWQQLSSQYANQGQMAMMDTMGQAAALTGGYGNSYASQVGQQTYQGYLQQLNDRVPELYQLALDAYNREGDQLLNKYGILGAQEEQDYGRYQDSLNAYYAGLDRLQNAYDTERGFDYQIGRDQVADAQWQAQYDEALRQFNFANKLGEFAPKPVESSGGGVVYTGGNPPPKDRELTEEEQEFANEIRYALENALNNTANYGVNVSRKIGYRK